MGILVSWINTAWSIADARLIGYEHPGEHDNAGDDENERPPGVTNDQPSHDALTERPSSVATDIPSIETPAPPSPHGQTSASPALFAPAVGVGALDSKPNHSVSLDHNLDQRWYSMAEDFPLPDTSKTGHLTPNRAAASSPPLSASPALHIDVAAANDPTMDHEMIDASFVSTAGVPDPSADLCFDDEGLSALEKIYLFSRSAASFHRVFIARSLASFLPDVAPSEAVEYVIPLMNGLAMDEDEAVKEALVEDLVSSIWWFLTHCRIVEHEVPEGAEPQEVPLLNVQAFTPLLGTLLLNPSANVNAPARHCVVNLLARIREATSDVAGSFGSHERKLFERELLERVVIGMAHLDNDLPAEETDGSNALMLESATERSDTPSVELRSPPPSAADDEVLLLTLTSSVHALATSQFLAQEEPLTSTVATIAASIQRPPSPIPSLPHAAPVPEPEPEFAHIVSGPATSVAADAESAMDLGSPMNVVTPLPTWATEPTQNLHAANASREKSMDEIHRPRIRSPSPEHVREAEGATLPDGLAYTGAEIDYNDEQAAIGKLASMSLIAAVTSSGSLDREFQSAFVEEVKRAGHDSVYWVRREATFALGALAKVVPEELLQVFLLPLFESFCEDPIWNVRQSVLFALPAILSRLPSDSRRMRALQTIQRLSIDPSPQVRTGVLEVLGEVIYSFHEQDKGPPDEIIRLFVGEEGQDWHNPDNAYLEQPTDSEMRHSSFRSRFQAVSNNFLQVDQHSRSSTPKPNRQAQETDPARPLICAFNLPAVALTLGQSRWDELRGLYLHLVRTGAPKVRQTLAASIGEVARIIGPANARRDLIYCWWDFARGRDTLVRTKALEALEVFLQVLEDPERMRIVGSLEEIWDNHLQNWREREVFARSLDRLARLFPKDGAALRSLLRRALRDPAAAVRNAAIDAYPQIYGYVLTHPQALHSITEEVFSLAHDESFKKRLTYVECARALITSDSSLDRFLDEGFWQCVVALASDKIADVRIALARLLGIVCDKILARQRTLPGGVLNIIRKLSEDTVPDVRAFVSHILPSDLRPPKELVYGHVLEVTRSMATFSRPPPRRPKTLSAGINNLTISEAPREEMVFHEVMDQATG